MLADMLSNGYDIKTKKTFRTMQRNAERLLRLINEMLDLSKLETGRMKLELAAGG